MNSPQWRLSWPSGQGSRVAKAVLRAQPEHFQVEEFLGLAGFPSAPASIQVLLEGEPLPGQGEHLCVRLEKRGDNTDYVARELARLSGCQPHDIGFCGLKDRHAVTRQWFSVYRPGMMASDAGFLAALWDRWSLLGVCRFARKLRRGEHQANHFNLLLTEIEGEPEQINARLAHIAEVGCPNYFGSQRFGWHGNNLEQACRMKPGRQRGRNRLQGLYFSAARSWLFNEVLAARVADGTWTEALNGEPEAGAVTGPLWGDGGTRAGAEQGSLERELVARHPRLEAVFSQTRMKPERRPLVLHPISLSWRWEGAGDLRLMFGLSPGQFATVLLDDVFELNDAAQASQNIAE